MTLLPSAERNKAGNTCMNASISICICTLRRLTLERTLESLKHQALFDGTMAEIVIIDNDAAGSARAIIERMAHDIPFPIRYDIEPRKGLSFARNRALETARGDWLALIDDDEIAEPNWIAELLNCARSYGADAAVGTVRPRFETKPPYWMARSPMFDVLLPATGTRIGMAEGNTANALLRAEFFKNCSIHFDPALNETGSEDTDFFGRALDLGAVVVSAREAVVYDLVSPLRMTAQYQIQRSLSVGENTARLKHRYGGALPLLGVIGRAGFNVVAALALMIASWPWSRAASYRYFIFFIRNIGKFRYCLGVPAVKPYA
jgi:succinoglycan biosynthesis protein ExoM